MGCSMSRIKPKCYCSVQTQTDNDYLLHISQLIPYSLYNNNNIKYNKIYLSNNLSSCNLTPIQECIESNNPSLIM